jgi:hypothetical protein
MTEQLVGVIVLYEIALGAQSCTPVTNFELMVILAGCCCVATFFPCASCVFEDEAVAASCQSCVVKTPAGRA